MKTKLLWYLMTILAAFVALYGFVFLLIPSLGAQEIRERFLDPPIVGISHVYGGGIALLLGPFLLNNKLRARFLNTHRFLGRVYLLAVLASGLSGLYLATVTFGGLSAQIGFGVLAILWLWSGSMALVRIRQGDQTRHRVWMYRNYALTYAAVTLRFALPAMMANGIPFEAAYQTIAWMSWVPNLIVTEWCILKR